MKHMKPKRFKRVSIVAADNGVIVIPDDRNGCAPGAERVFNDFTDLCDFLRKHIGERHDEE